MTKHQLFVLTALLCMAAPSYAIPILSVIAAPEAAEVGSSVSVDVSIEGLNGERVGDYDLGLTFDGSILSFGSVTFGAALGYPDSSLTRITAETGSVEVSEVSLLWLLTGQDGFTPVSLFSVAFDVIGVGTSPLQLYVNAIGDEFGDPLDFLLTEEAMTSVTGIASPSVSVPEPATVLLLGGGLVGIVMSRRRRH